MLTTNYLKQGQGRPVLGQYGARRTLTWTAVKARQAPPPSNPLETLAKDQQSNPSRDAILVSRDKLVVKVS